MGRKLKGRNRFRDGAWRVEVGGDHIGSYQSEKKAERMRQAIVRQREGEAPDAFAEFGAEWMDLRELDARRRGRSRAFDKERSRWNAHIVGSKLWDIGVRRMTPKLVQAWIGAMFKKDAMQVVRCGDTTRQRPLGRKLSRASVAQALKLLKLCLDYAVIDGKLATNPARLAKLPREEPREHDGELIVHCSLAEIAALFALAELPPMQRAVFAIAIYCGLREDELWGLRWTDVHLEGARPQLQVRRSYDGAVKTKTSVRDVPILPPAAAELRAWRTLSRGGVAAIALAGLVFPNAEGKCHSESFTAGWRSKDERRGPNGSLRTVLGWRAKAGIRDEICFKDLRHTCGCHLAQGSWTRPFSLHEIKRWLGHSSIAVTERHYASLTSDNLHNAVAEQYIAGK